MTITQKSPKQFRFSLVGRMQGYVLDVVEELYYANDIFVTPESRAGWAQRQAHQRKAMSTLKLLVYVAQISREQGAIQPKQYEQIRRAKEEAGRANIQNLLGAWINSDSKRLRNSRRQEEKKENQIRQE